jgi:hypothetical protein
MPINADATCPVDGTRFTYGTTPSYSVFGRALDGLPFGSWVFPLALPVCPSCGFLAVFGELQPEERERARALVESEAWAAAANEASYWRLNLAETAIGRARGPRRVDRLLSATWQTYGDPERYGRYVRELSEALAEISDAMRAEDAESWSFLQTFVANAERQAGDFKAAAARLDRLEWSGLNVEGVPDLVTRTRELIADGDRRQARI